MPNYDFINIINRSLPPGKELNATFRIILLLSYRYTVSVNSSKFKKTKTRQ
jgi:hypothetical protein